MKTGLDTYRDTENSGYMRQTYGSVLKRKHKRLHVFRHSIDSTIYNDSIFFFFFNFDIKLNKLSGAGSLMLLCVSERVQ